MSVLRTYIKHCVSISEEELDAIESMFEKKVIPKKTVLLRNGEICKFEAFILKGCIKTYYINKEGVEVILTFSTEEWWISDITSFQEQTPRKCL